MKLQMNIIKNVSTEIIWPQTQACVDPKPSKDGNDDEANSLAQQRCSISIFGL